jgi:hypothetical protein
MARKAKAKARVVPLRRGRPRKVAAEDDGGKHVRQLAPERTVRAVITEIIAAKNQTSEIGQELTEATKRANELGVNIPAVRIAARVYGKAKMDAAKARVLWEDVVYYLMECTDFDQIAPAGMFTSVEGGQRHSPPDEMQMVEGDEPPPMAAQAEEDEGGHVTH